MTADQKDERNGRQSHQADKDYADSFDAHGGPPVCFGSSVTLPFSPAYDFAKLLVVQEAENHERFVFCESLNRTFTPESVKGKLLLCHTFIGIALP